MQFRAPSVIRVCEMLSGMENPPATVTAARCVLRRHPQGLILLQDIDVLEALDLVGYYLMARALEDIDFPAAPLPQEPEQQV